MRNILVTACLLAAALAGCAAPEPVPAEATLASAKDSAHAHFSDPIFLGMAGIEGTLDLEAMKDFIRAEAAEEDMEEEADKLLASFDFERPQGDIGDGVPGFWFHAYTNATWAKLLILQVGSNGVIGSYVWDDDAMGEDEVEVEAQPLALSLPGLDRLMPDRMASSSAAAYTCTLETTVDWKIDSRRATEVVRAESIFQEHVAAHPDGEFIYVYVPTYRESCDGDEWSDGNMWIVAHADLDLLWNGTEPSVAYGVVSADNGTLLVVEVDSPMEYRVLFDDEVTFQGPLVPTLGVLPPATGAQAFEVPAGTTYLYVTASGDGALRIVDPDGNVVDQGDGEVWNWLEAPKAGTWSVDTTTATTTPNEAFGFSLYAEAELPAGE